MSKDDKAYQDLYVRMKRLMSMNARENAQEVNGLRARLVIMRQSGKVSKKVIELAPYLPWR